MKMTIETALTPAEDETALGKLLGQIHTAFLGCCVKFESDPVTAIEQPQAGQEAKVEESSEQAAEKPAGDDPVGQEQALAAVEQAAAEQAAVENK